MPQIQVIDNNTSNAGGAVSGTQSAAGAGGVMGGLGQLQQFAMSNGWTPQQWEAISTPIVNAFNQAGALSWAQFDETVRWHNLQQQASLAQTAASQGSSAAAKEANQIRKDQGGQELALGRDELGLKRELGMGELALGKEELGLKRELGYGELQLNREKLGLSRQELEAMERERQRRYDLDAEIQRGQLATRRAEALIGAPRGPADWFAYTARLASLQNPNNPMGGFLGNLLATQSGVPLAQLQAGPVLNNTQYAQALLSGQVAGLPPYLQPAATGSTLPVAPSVPVQFPGGYAVNARDWSRLEPTAREVFLGASEELGGENRADFLFNIGRNLPNFRESTPARLG